MDRRWSVAAVAVLVIAAAGGDLPAQTTGLTFIPGSSVRVEQLVADCDWQSKALTGTCAPTANQTTTRYNIHGTDLGSSFEHNGKVIFLFGDTISVDANVLNYGAGDTFASSTSTDPEAPLRLDFYTTSTGSPLFIRMPNSNISMGGNNTPNAGISLPDGIYFVANIGADTPAGKPSDRSILIRFDENARTFTPGRTVSTHPGHFIHTSLHKHGSDVLIFGEGNYRASDVYLSSVPAASFASGAGTKYFTGLVNGQPTWSSNDADSVPVVQDNPLNGPGWPNGSPGVGNMSVIYSDALKLWMMTYDGGRQSPTTSGVYFTYAKEPWGPWAAPQLIFNATRENASGTFIHNPQIQPNPPGDGLNGPTIGGNDPFTTPGGPYAPYLIERFTTVSGDRLKIHYVLSTWNPYTVVRMRSEFKIALQSSFTIANRGADTLNSAGSGAAVAVGYGRVQPDSGSTPPSGVAIFSLRQNNTVVSEVGVPAVPARISGRMYAEIGGNVNAGIAIANPGSSPATVSFQFVNAAGQTAGAGSITVPANQHIAQFLDQAPFKVYSTATFSGTFNFTSNVPVAMVALRGLTNERGDFLMSTLPVVDVDTSSTAPVVIPHFADGAGWTTQVLLVNPTDVTVTGTVQFSSPTGQPVTVSTGSPSGSFSYSIPRRSSQKIVTSGANLATVSGSIRVSPSGGTPAPVPLTVFTYRAGGVTVAEAGVPVAASTAFRVYVESSGAPGQIGNIDSGIAVTNASSASTTVTFELTNLQGAPVTGASPVLITLGGTGQTAKFLSDLFPALPRPFQGVLRISSSSSAVSVVGLRTRINERGEFLITTTPPADENGVAGGGEVYFPQVADGGGYTTQFIVFSGRAGQSASGMLSLTRQDGSAWEIPLNRSVR